MQIVLNLCTERYGTAKLFYKRDKYRKKFERKRGKTKKYVKNSETLDKLRDLYKEIFND